MTRQQLMEYCLKKTGAYIDHPFGPDSTILKVEKRIFAQFFQLKGNNCVTFNCDRMTGELYRQMFPGLVVRGYHCPPVQQPYFNTFSLDAGLPEDVILDMADHSYAVVTGKLPKHLQQRLKNLENS